MGEATGTISGYASTAVAGNSGIANNTGVLSYNSKVTIQQIKDGTSNTIMVGECSAVYFDGTTQQPTWTPSGWYSWSMGVSTTSIGPITGDNRCFNCLTVRYPINTTGITGSTAGSNAGATGVGSDCGVNYPISSAHSGGANVLFADGGVHFLDSSITVDILGRLANRNDGLPTGYSE
jgi:prepilin-type processing-associated H-X9-DG protein